MVLGESNNQPRPAFRSPRRERGEGGVMWGSNSAIWHMLYTHTFSIRVYVWECDRWTSNGIVRTAVQLCTFYPLTANLSLSSLSTRSMLFSRFSVLWLLCNTDWVEQECIVWMPLVCLNTGPWRGTRTTLAWRKTSQRDNNRTEMIGEESQGCCFFTFNFFI